MPRPKFSFEVVQALVFADIFLLANVEVGIKRSRQRGSRYVFYDPAPKKLT